MTIFEVMDLRDHPLMSYRGIPNWPPVWICGTTNKRLTGEVGILARVINNEKLRAKCFLVIEYETHVYTGCLLFDDESFSRQISELLEFYIGSSIRDIGSIDLAYTA